MVCEGAAGDSGPRDALEDVTAQGEAGDWAPGSVVCARLSAEHVGGLSSHCAKPLPGWFLCVWMRAQAPRASDISWLSHS